MSVETYDPINTLKPVADDVWIVDGPIIRMPLVGRLSVPFPTRMTVARLGDGSLWCHSPTAWSAPLADALAALGPVAHLVSPNWLHYASIPDWQRRHPAAVTWASPGVRARARRQGVAVTFARDLDDAPPAAWTGEIDQLVFCGSRFLNEVVFFHRASRTLIVTDLIQSFEPEKVARRWRWLLRLGGVAHPDGQTPLDLRLSFLGRHATARAHLARMLAWQPERVILAHGRWFARDGAAELARAFRWCL